MGKLILLVLVGVLMSLPACLIAYFILSAFPNCSYLVLAFISIASVIGTIVLLDLWQTKKAAASTQKVSYEKVGSLGRILGLIFTSLFGVYFVFQSNKIDLFVDNQNDTEMNVSVNNHKIKLAAFEYKKISVVEGKLTLKQGDLVKVLEPKEDSIGKAIYVKDNKDAVWIWNINGKGIYVKTDVHYGTKISIGIQNKPEEEDEVKIITDELFKVKADFIFDIPKTIKTKSQYSFVGETRTALYRMNDLQDKYSENTGDYMEEQKSEISTEDSVVVKSTKSQSKKK